MRGPPFCYVLPSSLLIACQHRNSSATLNVTESHTPRLLALEFSLPAQIFCSCFNFMLGSSRATLSNLLSLSKRYRCVHKAIVMTVTFENNFLPGYTYITEMFWLWASTSCVVFGNANINYNDNRAGLEGGDGKGDIRVCLPAGPATVLSHNCDIPSLPEGRPKRTRKSLASTVSVHCVPAASYCHPCRHANVVAPCLLSPCLDLPKTNRRTKCQGMFVLPVHKYNYTTASHRNNFFFYDWVELMWITVLAVHCLCPLLVT